MLFTCSGQTTECQLYAVKTLSFLTMAEGIKRLALWHKLGLEGERHCVCARFPIGGESISVTSGVVSRIEVTSYVHGAAELLGVQIDAAINSGNSGGPAFNNRGQCVGIAFQSLKVSAPASCGNALGASSLWMTWAPKVNAAAAAFCASRKLRHTAMTDSSSLGSFLHSFGKGNIDCYCLSC